MKIQKTKEGTIYNIKDEQFRIVQLNGDTFVIEKNVKTKEYKYRFFYNKNIEKNKWEKIDKLGNYSYKIPNTYPFMISPPRQLFMEYKTLNDAIEWLEDYNKYPIYH